MLILGGLMETGGKGGSSTSSFVSTGFGGSLGGRSERSGVRPPGLGAVMYNGGTLYPRHRFSNIAGKNSREKNDIVK